PDPMYRTPSNVVASGGTCPLLPLHHSSGSAPKPIGRKSHAMAAASGTCGVQHSVPRIAAVFVTTEVDHALGTIRAAWALLLAASPRRRRTMRRRAQGFERVLRRHQEARCRFGPRGAPIPSGLGERERLARTDGRAGGAVCDLERRLLAA